MRAWAILMMLQGHFVDGLLDNAFRDNGNVVYSLWNYFRGITAPVFFTVSGFIFTYLLVRGDKMGLENPRVMKGIRRGLQLLFIGYLLRMNLFGLLKGEIYESFYLVDVLHCIGFSILGIVGIYLLTKDRAKRWFPIVLASITFLLFILEPWYKGVSLGLPLFIENYFSKANGSVFTLFPWFGYSTFGAFIAILFTRFKAHRHLYPIAIGISLIIGSGLIFYSSDIFLELSKLTSIELFSDIHFNNYLFIRLGDVLLAFAVFMLFRSLLQNATLLKIGQSTLSIYVIHFVILYGSLTGLGLYGFFNHSLSPAVAIPGAIIFMMVCAYAALQYEKKEEYIKLNIASTANLGIQWAEKFIGNATEIFKASFYRLLRYIGLVRD